MRDFRLTGVIDCNRGDLTKAPFEEGLVKYPVNGNRRRLSLAETLTDGDSYKETFIKTLTDKDSHQLMIFFKE